MHPNLVVVRTQAPIKERTLYCLGGAAPQVNLRVNNSDIGTLEAALCTRMFTCEVNGEYVEPPRPSPQLVEDRMGYARALLGNFGSTPESHEEVVDQYVGRKKALYEAARVSLVERPVRKEDAISCAFVKPEKVNPNKAPRCIQPRDPRYNLSLGAYVKHIEHRLYKRVSKSMFKDGPTIMKGYNVKQVGSILAGKWNSFNNPVAVGLDATKFDMHVSPEILEWEHSIYRSIFPNDRHLRRLLEWQMHNVGRGYCQDGKLKYHVKGKRFSGDMNTALGNCLIMCTMVHAYATHVGVECKLVNNGDDCVVFMEKSDLCRFSPGLEKWFLGLGFRMVAEAPVYDLPEVEFCQMRPIRTAEGVIMVRNIPTALAKDTMCLLPLRNDKEFREWMGAVGGCGAALCSGVPIMQEFYKRMSHHGTTRTNFATELIANSGFGRLSIGMEAREAPILDETRYDVWKAWGILPDHQVALEAMYQEFEFNFGTCSAGSHDEHPSIML